MAREVVWTDPAWDDLEAAAEHITRDSEAYAAAFVEDIKAAATSLAEMAERGQVVPEIGDASIRELLVRAYRLVYQCWRSFSTMTLSRLAEAGTPRRPSLRRSSRISAAFVRP